MIVRCIDDDWSTVPEGSVHRAVLAVGDPMPEKGKEYKVKGYVHVERELVGYELEGLDYSNYPGGTLLFKKERFEKVRDSYELNHYDPDFGACELTTMYCTMSFPNLKIGKMPRKKKKHFKKYGMRFIHKGIKKAADPSEASAGKGEGE